MYDLLTMSNLPTVPRRAFLGALPYLLTSAKGSPTQPVMGSGEHTYEVTHDFLQLPPQLKFGNAHGIVVDAAGRIIVAHTVHKTSESGDAIAIFDASGKFVKSWGSDMRGGAHGLTIRKEGSQEFLYHCDNVRGFVRKTTLAQRPLRRGAMHLKKQAVSSPKRVRFALVPQKMVKLFG